MTERSFSVNKRKAPINHYEVVMAPKDVGGTEVPTHVKDKALVDRRRRQIVDAAVPLFVENGYHKTTTRQIARSTGFSIGSLYEYVSTKEDILYLVCDAIHAEMEESLSPVQNRRNPGLGSLKDAVRGYFTVCDGMSDHILLIYQVTQFLPDKWKNKVLENEIRVTNIFKTLLQRIVVQRELVGMDERRIDLVAHNISVLGHAWAFRRWFYARHYRLEDYIAFQTKNIIGAVAGNGS